MYYSLPLVAETQFAGYLQSGVSVTYQKTTPTGIVSNTYEVFNAFRTGELYAPCVVVEAQKFTEKEPFTNVYRGLLEVGILTQIDDSADPIGDHDKAVNQVYSLMVNQGALSSGVNAANFHLWGYYNTDYEQRISDGKDMPRVISTRLEYLIEVQNSGVSQ